jgi:hypothetical protein
MLKEKSPRGPSRTESELRKTLPVEELQTVTHEFLTLLSVLNHEQALTTTTTTYLKVQSKKKSCLL